ncbi:MAG: hypothetical protein JNL21_33050 [Myxococcales bacterium]|nr:hypothetical protein [Myxococcales bacterium]
MRRLLLFPSLVLLLPACGGLVVFEIDEGTGGATSTTGTTAQGSTVQSGSTSQVGSTSSGNPCDALDAELLTAIDHALACSPLDPTIQCDGTVMILDTCACPIVANEDNVSEVEAARAAYDAWVAAGCGPYPCETCVVPQGGFCMPQGGGGKGRCAGILPD